MKTGFKLNFKNLKDNKNAIVGFAYNNIFENDIFTTFAHFYYDYLRVINFVATHYTYAHMAAVQVSAGLQCIFCTVQKLTFYLSLTWLLQ